MESASVFSVLESVNKKPRPFSVYTASELWTDAHTSEQMLAFHLNGEIDVSSRRTSFIDNSVCWMKEHFELSGSSMAAGVVTGAAALMLERNPELTNDQIKAILMYAAEKLESRTDMDRLAARGIPQGLVSSGDLDLTVGR